MKTTTITELLKVEALQTTTDEQILAKTGIVNSFLEKQDGFIDAEVIKAVEGNIWYFIYHIENMEKLRTTGEKLRASKLFDQIIPLIVPGSMSVSFYRQIGRW
jgi:hypothetical protein